MRKEVQQTLRYVSSRCRDGISGWRARDATNETPGILCLQPFHFLEITTSGDVYTCCPGWVRFPIGNIRNRTIGEIWNSRRARHIRRKIYQGSWRTVCNSLCPRISEYNRYGGLIPYDCLESFDFLTPQLISEIRMRREHLDSPPTVFNLSNSTVCNLSCIMCDRVNQRDDPELIEKTAQEVYSYLPTARRLVLTGMGDPLARPDTRRLLMEFRSENPDFAFDIVTNGLLLPQYWDRIKHQRFGNLLISVDASKKESYEKIRIGGAWDGLVKSLDMVRENRANFGSVTINMTVMLCNYREIPEFIDLAESYGFNASFQRIRGNHGQNFFGARDVQVIRELTAILEQEGCRRRGINIFWEDLVEFMKDCGPPPDVLSEETILPQDENMETETKAEAGEDMNEKTETSMTLIINRLQEDAPLFHDDGSGGLTTWFSNTNLLASLERLLSPGMRTIETGSGYSTIVFLANQCVHTCVVPVKEEIERIKEYCLKAGISCDKAEFIISQSHDILPSYPGRDFDLFFVDGAHRFPFPIIDWFYGAILLKEKGLMVVDDTDIVSCHMLCEFMLSDDHWELVEQRENFVIFRKLGNHDYPCDWQGQVFSSRKIEQNEEVRDEPLPGVPEQAQG